MLLYYDDWCLSDEDADAFLWSSWEGSLIDFVSIIRILSQCWNCSTILSFWIPNNGCFDNKPVYEFQKKLLKKELDKAHHDVIASELSQSQSRGTKDINRPSAATKSTTTTATTTTATTTTTTTPKRKEKLLTSFDYLRNTFLPGKMLNIRYLKRTRKLLNFWKEITW